MLPVIVVGAGPAGATAARTLARAGVTVTLLDRSKFPRNKPCGGGISLRVLKRFPYLERALGTIATHTVGRLHFEGPDGKFAILESDGPAVLLIRRMEFDALLVDLARESGAGIMTGVDVVNATAGDSGVVLQARDGRRFEAPIVIAADGVHSVVGRRLGLNPGWPASSVALDMMEETPRAALRDLDPSTMWVSYGYAPPEKSKTPGRPAAEGYAYIFPKRDHVNVGVGYVLDHYRTEVASPPYELQRGLVDHLRKRGVMEGESVRTNFTPFIIPVGGPVRPPGRGRVLLAGDAAGFVNGFTAEGIYYAMVSGELAARAILNTPANALAKLASRYQRACDEEMGTELGDSVLLQRYLFADRSRIARVIKGASTPGALTRSILDVAVGRSRYRDLRRRVIAGAPLMAAQLAWIGLRSKWRAARARGMRG